MVDVLIITLPPGGSPTDALTPEKLANAEFVAISYGTAASDAPAAQAGEDAAGPAGEPTFPTINRASEDVTMRPSKKGRRATGGGSARRWPWWVALGGSAALAAVVMASGVGLSAGGVPDSGMMCTDGGGGANASFTLTTTTGRIRLPDGNTSPMWGFAAANGGYQYPSPTLCVTEGQTVTVVLNNTLPEPVSIVFPGQAGVLANGVPSAPQFSGVRVTSMAPAANAANGTVSYRFTASRPGTFLYESGTDQGKQVQMGLFGALVVRPKTDTLTSVFGSGTDTAYKAGREFLMMLSDLDPDLHQRVAEGKPVDISGYRPRYWFINGRSFPDTVAPNNYALLPSQPYSGLIHVEPYGTGAGYDDAPALLRYVNVSGVDHPFHPHGNHGRVVGIDGHPVPDPTGGNPYALSGEKFTVDVGPGQTQDVLYSWTDTMDWATVQQTTATRALPPENMLQDLIFKDGATYYSGSPYLGRKDELPVGTTSYNQCGEFYHVAHSHGLFEATNYGAAMGGMLTLWRIDPPGGCTN